MRAFVAVWPSPAVTEQLTAIDRPARPGIRWTTPDQWHITLRFLGEIGEEELAGVKGGLGQLGSVGPRGPLTAVAGPALIRLGKSVLCLPVAGLDPVAAAVVESTAGLGAPPEDRSFRGHLTIARAARGVDPRPPAPVAFHASWELREVTLVASALHRDGARYQVIGRYRLDGSEYSE